MSEIELWDGEDEEGNQAPPPVLSVQQAADICREVMGHVAVNPIAAGIMNGLFPAEPKSPLLLAGPPGKRPAWKSMTRDELLFERDGYRIVLVELARSLHNGGSQEMLARGEFMDQEERQEMWELVGTALTNADAWQERWKEYLDAATERFNGVSQAKKEESK